jgi:hypothetical protein
LSRDFSSAAKITQTAVRASIRIASCPLSRNEDKNFELFSIQGVAMLQSLNCMSEVGGKKEKSFIFLLLAFSLFTKLKCSQQMASLKDMFSVAFQLST